MEAGRVGPGPVVCAREADVAPAPDPTGGRGAMAGWTPADPGPLGLAGFAGTTFVLSLINSKLVGSHAAPGGGLLPMVAGLALAYGGIAQLAGRDVGVPHRQHVRCGGVLLLRRLLDLVLLHRAFSAARTRRPRCSAGSVCTCGCGGSSPPTCSSPRCGQPGPSRWCSCCWRSRSSSWASATRRWPVVMPRSTHDQDRWLRRDRDRDRGLVRVVCGGDQLDVRPRSSAAGVPAQEGLNLDRSDGSGLAAGSNVNRQIRRISVAPGRRRSGPAPRSRSSIPQAEKERLSMADTTQDTATEEEVEYSEDKIAVHWREEEYVEPPEQYTEQANANDKSILERFAPENFPDCFVEYAELLDWDKKWDEIVDTSNPPFFKWWVGGKLNACVNCVDRHLESRGDENAIIWVAEPEDDETGRDHLQGAAPPGQRVRRAAEGLLRRQAAGPGHLPHADGPRAAGGDAGLRAAGRDPLAGVRRLQRRGLRASGWATPRARSWSRWMPTTATAI